MTSVRIVLAALTGLCALIIAAVALEKGQAKDQESLPVWTIPDIDTLPDDPHGRLVRHGRDLILMTYAFLGPHAPDRDTRFAGNNLACSNCHLEAGTKKFGLPIYGLSSDFPRYSARMGAEISIEDRVNSCMTRSMNGRPLPVPSPEMQALKAYITFFIDRPHGRRARTRAWRGHDPRTRPPRRSQTWKARLYPRLSRLPQHQWLWHRAKPASVEPWLCRSASLGSRQFQRWRRDGKAHHADGFSSFQHAAWSRLPEPDAFH